MQDVLIFSATYISLIHDFFSRFLWKTLVYLNLNGNENSSKLDPDKQHLL